MPVETLLSGKDCVFSTEPEEHCRIHGTDRIISNAFMACVPGHPFFQAITKELLTHISSEKNWQTRVLDTTGPLMLNRVYRNYSRPETITLLPSAVMNPLSYMEAEQYLKGSVTGQIGDKINAAWGVHYHSGSWWKTQPGGLHHD